MRDNVTPSIGGHTTPLSLRDGVVALSGYGIRVAVDRGHLRVEDGIGRARRSAALAKATCGLKRLVVLGHTGEISFDALRWLHGIGAAFVQIDANGDVIAAVGPARLNDPSLRRLQAIAAYTDSGLAIARDLVRQKIEGQLSVAATLGTSGLATDLTRQLGEIESARTIDQLRLVEARAAAQYWGSWNNVSISFARKDASRVPAHWVRFGTRSSPLTGSPRTAANPANALLNYLYAIVESETRIAILTMGLDPGIGVMHADQTARDSLALDVMEAIRPHADAYLLKVLGERSFAARDFFETRTGSCRLMPPLPQLLVSSAPHWQRLISPVVERVAHMFSQISVESAPSLRSGSKAANRQSVPTLLTESRRSAGRDGIRRQNKPQARPLPALSATCTDCGTSLDDDDRKYCDRCFSERMARPESYTEAGQLALSRMRNCGTDPAHGGMAAGKRRAHNAQRKLDVATWNQANPIQPDDDLFRRDILPDLQGVPLSHMRKFSGLSLRYCSLIRQGLHVPHPRHWEALRAAAS
jgi:CRISPR-associated endonuclease Cas1